MTRLKTPVAYVESLWSLEIRAYVGGEQVGSIVDNRSIAPHIKSADVLVKKTQMLRLLGQVTGTCFQRRTRDALSVCRTSNERLLPGIATRSDRSSP